MRRPRILTIVIHAACWLLFLGLPLVFIGGTEDNQISNLVTSFEYWFFCVTYFLSFYLVANVLIPYLFIRKRYFFFSVSILALFFVVVLLSPFAKLMDANRAQMRPDVGNFEPGFLLPSPDRPLPDIDRFPERDNRPTPPVDRFRRNDGQPPPPGDRPLGRNFELRPPRVGPFARNHFDIVSIFMFLVVVALGMTIRISKQWRLSEQRAIQAEADKAQAELSFLKAQINPHFLFNTLNNLYVLALTRSDNTAESIMRLSNIMRYVTDEAGKEWVSVNAEVNCIKDYIELQRLRIGKQTQITFEIDPGLENWRIAPLIFMSFVENAFKYGISAHHPGEISIALRKKNDKMEFNCSNPVFQSGEAQDRIGVGIANAKQRLDYLYSDKYLLDIRNDRSLFIVKLVLPFLQKNSNAAEMHRN